LIAGTLLVARLAKILVDVILWYVIRTSTLSDSIRALVQVDVKYGFDQEVVSTEYRILRVLRVIHRERPEQRLLGE